MRYFASLVFSVFILTSCVREVDPSAIREELLQADRDFCAMATEKGIDEAFLYYADEKVIKPVHGQQPVVGKFALMQWHKENPAGDEKLTWYPLRAEGSGTLGYTFGGYELRTKSKAGTDTVYYGNYVSVWKRKSDGNWRYVVDMGNPTDGPVTLKR